MYESEHLPRSLQEHKCPLGKKDYGSEPINRNVNKMIVLSMNKTYNHVINVDKKSYMRDKVCNVSDGSMGTPKTTFLGSYT